MSIFNDAEKEAEKVWAELCLFFSADVWPLIKETLVLIEKGGAEALTNAAAAALPSLEAGRPFSEIVAAVEGTLVNSGIQVLEGAAATAIQLVKNKLSAQDPAPTPPAAA